jgi:hypothetical protein
MKKKSKAKSLVDRRIGAALTFVLVVVVVLLASRPKWDSPGQ